MPRKTTRGKDLKDEASIISAIISRKGAVTVAIIAALGTILAAFIVKRSSENSGREPLTESYKYVGRVLDRVTGNNIRAAKISLEGNGERPAVDFTDSEGVFSFPVKDPKKEIHLRIEAPGYDNFNLGVVPSNIDGIQVVHLTPTPSPATPQPGQTISPAPTGQPAAPKVTNNTNTNAGDMAGSKEANLSVSGTVIDPATNEPVAGARVYVDGYSGESTVTKADGKFKLATHTASGEMFWIRAEKEGYTPKEIMHQAGSQTVTVRLSKK